MTVRAHWQALLGHVDRRGRAATGTRHTVGPGLVLRRYSDCSRTKQVRRSCGRLPGTPARRHFGRVIPCLPRQIANLAIADHGAARRTLPADTTVGLRSKWISLGLRYNGWFEVKMD